MNIPEVSKCFDIRNHIEYKKHFTTEDSQRLIYPFTYLIWFGEYLCTPSNTYRDGTQCGFLTMEQADRHRDDFIKTVTHSSMSANTIGVVLKKSEGRNTMRFDKAFRSVSEAHEYIMQQDVFGTNKHAIRFISAVDGSLQMLQTYKNNAYKLFIEHLY